jgi:hypothetical protein
VFFKRSFNGRQISGNEIGNELIKGNGNFKSLVSNKNGRVKNLIK